MGIVDKMKASAQKSGTVVQSSEAEELHKLLSKAFYLPHDIDNEVKFVRMVMTRGADTQERVGLHASAILVPDSSYCEREQVLSLLYKQRQGDQVSPGLMRIFAEGNAIHEKWQRLFIAAGWSTWDQLDYTQYAEQYMMSFTPDIICTIPEFDSQPMVGEIKSVNTFAFKKQLKHPSAWKQCQWYMHLTGLRRGFVLSEDKNTQDFRLEVYDYDKSLVEPWVDRAESVVDSYHRVVEDHKMVKRPKQCTSPSCKRCEKCAMRDACWGVGMGKVKIGSAH